MILKKNWANADKPIIGSTQAYNPANLRRKTMRAAAEGREARRAVYLTGGVRVGSWLITQIFEDPFSAVSNQIDTSFFCAAISYSYSFFYAF